MVHDAPDRIHLAAIALPPPAAAACRAPPAPSLGHVSQGLPAARWYSETSSKDSGRKHAVQVAATAAVEEEAGGNGSERIIETELRLEAERSYLSASFVCYWAGSALWCFGGACWWLSGLVGWLPLGRRRRPGRAGGAAAAPAHRIISAGLPALVSVAHA